ncbi:MAG: metallophosphoesterase family protein [Actinomycetota bacterium]|nr:metallophosphoesterase family protein [Actinomycetota bacterium]
MTTDRVRVAVVADTHLRAGTLDRLPTEVWRRVAAADVVLHAGDVVEDELLAALAAETPTHAVLGNNDTAIGDRLPETLELVLGGVRVAMIHDSGTSAGRAGRMRRRFPDADIVVFGHSHLPLDEEGDGGQRLFNPGSPTQRRRAPTHTMGELVLADGEIAGHALVHL